MQLQISEEGGAIVAELSGEIDHHVAKPIREAIDKELLGGGHKTLVIDFSGVSFMDSSGLGLILGRVNTAEKIGGFVIVRGLSRELYKIVSLSGVDRIKRLSVEP